MPEGRRPIGHLRCRATGEAFQDDIRPRLVRWQSIGRLAAASSPRRRGPSKGKPNLLAQHPLLPADYWIPAFAGMTLWNLCATPAVCRITSLNAVALSRG